MSASPAAIPMSGPEMHNEAFCDALCEADAILSRYFGPTTPIRLELKRLLEERFVGTEGAKR